MTEIKFSKSLIEHLELLENTKNIEQELDTISNLLMSTIQTGGIIYTCGNGGSASDSQHFTAELIGNFRKKRKSIPSICLNTDTSVLTAVANDFGYENIFTRQLEGLIKKNDILICFSTSGKSKNIINAAKYCRSKEIPVIGFIGNDGGLLRSLTTNSLIIPSSNTARIQEIHIFLIHILCEFIEGSIND